MPKENLRNRTTLFSHVTKVTFIRQLDRAGIEPCYSDESFVPPEPLGTLPLDSLSSDGYERSVFFL